jgi:hypothetical protein
MSYGTWLIEQIEEMRRERRRAQWRRYRASDKGRTATENWRAAHPMRAMLYDARYTVKQLKSRLEVMA